MAPSEVIERLRADGEIVQLRRESRIDELRDCADAVRRLAERIRAAHSGTGLSPWADGHLTAALAALSMSASSLDLADLEQVKALSERQIGGFRG